MKTLLVRILCFVLCIICVVSAATSCQNKDQVKVEKWDQKLIESDPANVKYDYFFESIEALLSAIKREPDKYNDANIKVVGTIYKGSSTLLVDFTATSENMPSTEASAGEAWSKLHDLQNAKNKIRIGISNDAQYAVSETGDYVKIYGTLKITRDEIYIAYCTYDLIATVSERSANVTEEE